MRDIDDDSTLFSEAHLESELAGPDGERRQTAVRAAAELTYLAGLRAAATGTSIDAARHELMDPTVLRAEFYGPDDERSEVAFRLWDDLSHLAALRAVNRPITTDERHSARRVINYVRELMNERRQRRVEGGYAC
jgi:hypothetical protein